MTNWDMLFMGIFMQDVTRATSKVLTVDATVCSIGAAPLLGCAIALHVDDVQRINVQALALHRTGKTNAAP